MHYMHIKSRGQCPEIFVFSHNPFRTYNLPVELREIFLRFELRTLETLTE
jgi:hypothetical protein